MKTATMPLSLLLLLISTSPAIADIIPAGPEYPAPGGNTAASSGAPGDAGGWDVDYSNFDVSGLAGLWQGLWGDAAVGLDGNSYPLSFSSISGGTATWDGNSPYTHPIDGLTNVPTRLEITITAGPVSWSALPIVGYTFPAIGAVIDNSAGADYSINVLFSADVGSGYEPLNGIDQLPPGGQSVGSIGLGFYSVPVPEPSSLALAACGIVAVVGWAARRRHWR